MSPALARFRLIVLAAMCATFFSACTTVPAPETPREILATAEITFVGVVDATLILNQQGVLSDDEVRTIIAKLQPISATLDEANTLLTSEVPPAASDLERITLALEAALTVLRSLSVELHQARTEGVGQ